MTRLRMKLRRIIRFEFSTRQAYTLKFSKRYFHVCVEVAT